MYRIALIVAAAGFATAGCGTDASTTETAATPATSGATAAAPPDATAGFPLTFQNCDADVTVAAAPERVVLLDSGGVMQLAAVDALDTVVARSGEYPPDYYSEAVNAALDKIDALVSEQTSVGGVDISIETVIEAEPDLVIGYETATITRDALTELGIPMYVLPAYCNTQPPPSFEGIVDEVTLFGQIFAEPDLAAGVVTDLEGRIAALADAPAVPEGTTGAALFVSSDGSAVYAYTSANYVNTQMEALGITNVFAGLTDFVPEVSVEELIEANPDVLILLYTDTALTPGAIGDLVVNLPGAEAITAVDAEAIYPLLLNFSQPGSPLVIEGTEKLAELVSR